MALPRHGKRGTKVYQAWIDMVRRCNNPNRPHYVNYGGRGIRVCEEWMVFENFYSDMGDPPEKMTLERIDVNGNYEPLNCKWATIGEQNRNKTTNRFLIVDEVRMTMAEASRIYGIEPSIIAWRLNKGWSDHDAAKKPSRGKMPNGHGRRK